MAEAVELLGRAEYELHLPARIPQALSSPSFLSLLTRALYPKPQLCKTEEGPQNKSPKAPRASHASGPGLTLNVGGDLNKYKHTIPEASG